MERWKQIMLAGVAVMGIWLIGGMRAEASVPVDEVNFPDPTVRSHVKAYDINQDGVLSNEELKIPTQFGRTTEMSGEVSFDVKSGTVVDFKGMENFPNIRELDFALIGNDKEREWIFGGSLLQCFPYAEKISLAGSYRDTFDGQITLSGTSDCLKKIKIDTRSLKVNWNVEAKNLNDISIRAYEVDGLRNGAGEISSLASLWLKCEKIQNCNLAFSKMPSLKYLNIAYSGISQKDLKENGVLFEELSRLRLETLEIDVEMQDFSFLSGLKYLEKLVIRGSLQGKKFSLKGLSALKELDLVAARFPQLDLSPVRKTLKTLSVGSAQGVNCIAMANDPQFGNQAFKVLDISQMESLETLYGTDTCLEKIITRDAAGHSALKKLKKVHLWYSRIKSINLADMPKLEELLMEGSFSKLDVAKCKNMKYLYIKSSNLKSINLKKNTKLKTLWIEGTKKVKKLDMKKNVKLHSLHLKGTKITSLDLSRNTFLSGLYLYSALRLKKLAMPPMKKSAVQVYHCKKSCKVNVLDLSRIKKFTKKTRGAYLHPFQVHKNYKKIILSKKVKKSDRNWFKKKAKKIKAKVLVK